MATDSSLPAPGTSAAPAEQLSRLAVSQQPANTANLGAAAQPISSTMISAPAPAGGKQQEARVIAAVGPAGAAAPAAGPAQDVGQNDRAAFAERVKAHFGRLMAGGGLAPAAAAAEALKLAAQQQ